MSTVLNSKPSGISVSNSSVSKSKVVKADESTPGVINAGDYVYVLTDCVVRLPSGESVSINKGYVTADAGLISLLSKMDVGKAACIRKARPEEIEKFV